MMTTTEERFWDLVDFAPDGCMEWMGAPDDNGYGRIGVGGKVLYAHRFSYELHNGEIPDGMMVLHTCDNKLCVNPDHLFLGTAKDRTALMLSRGHIADNRGENSPNSKLTEADVMRIRANYATGWTQTELAEASGVAQVTISQIVRRLSWRHV